MSQFYDQASLVMVPSGYKAGKVYSQKPLTTDGQLTFTRASTATRVNSSGLIESVATGVPRLDYSGGATCASLLLEPQRTNYTLSSEDFSNATYWTVSGNMTITANQAISPDGTQNADLIYDSGARYNFINSPVSSYYSFSCYFKRVDVTTVKITASDYYSGDVGAEFNLVNGTSLTSAGGGDWLNTSAKIESVGNGWYRCSLTALRGSGGSGVAYRIECAESAKSFYAWGYQTEVGAYATSYIGPTLSTAVTRVQDVTSKAGIGSLIGVNQGSIYVELDANGIITGGANYIFDLSDGTNFDQNRIAMYWTSANDLNIFYGYGGTYASGVYTSNYLTTKKVAVRWTSTQLQVVINGVAQTALTYGNSSPTKLSVGVRYNDVEPLASNVKQCLLFNNTLTAAQLQELTTL